MANSELYPRDAIVKAWKAYEVALNESTNHEPKEPQSLQKQMTLFVTVGLAAVLIVVMVILLFTAQPGPITIGLLIASMLFVPLIGGTITWFVMKALFVSKRFNFQSARQVTQKLQLRFCGQLPIKSEAIKGVLPRLHDNGTITPTAAVQLQYAGVVDGVQLYGIESLQEISIIKGFKGAMRTLTGVVARTSLVNVPDLILLPKNDPQIKYFETEVAGDSKVGAYQLQLNRWGAFGAGWEEKLPLLKAIEALIEKRADICVQILSGTVCIYRHIGDHMLIKKLTPEAIESDIMLVKDIAKLISKK